jgi:hypothetical protein
VNLTPELIFKLDPTAQVLPNGNIRFMTLVFNPSDVEGNNTRHMQVPEPKLGPGDYTYDDEEIDVDQSELDTEIFISPDYHPEADPHHIPFQYPQENPEKQEGDGV